jgi:hypothetical protein
MRKFVLIVLSLMFTLCVVGCVEVNGDSSEASGNNSEQSGITNDNSNETSYEDILNEYSQKLRDATPVLIEEYNEEAKSNQDGLMGLATLSNKKVSALAEISLEGTQKMANLHIYSGSGSYDEYSEWAGKLQDVYVEEAAKIQDAYMKSAQ